VGSRLKTILTLLIRIRYPYHPVSVPASLIKITDPLNPQAGNLVGNSTAYTIQSDGTWIWNLPDAVVNGPPICDVSDTPGQVVDMSVGTEDSEYPPSYLLERQYGVTRDFPPVSPSNRDITILPLGGKSKDSPHLTGNLVLL
jgi:hypothetical protein